MNPEEAARPCLMESTSKRSVITSLGFTALAHTALIIATRNQDAYGHRIGSFVKRLVTSGVHYVAIGSLRDAHTIRIASVELPLLMFCALFPREFTRSCSIASAQGA
jgi:alanine racemase